MLATEHAWEFHEINVAHPANNRRPVESTAEAADAARKRSGKKTQQASRVDPEPTPEKRRPRRHEDKTTESDGKGDRG